jgi:hypothetical protein
MMFLIIFKFTPKAVNLDVNYTNLVFFVFF